MRYGVSNNSPCAGDFVLKWKKNIHIVQPESNGLTAKFDQYKSAAEKLCDTLLADLINIGEIPAPTFAEEPRIRFLVNRFEEIGLTNISIDTTGNGAGVIAGSEGHRTVNFLLVKRTVKTKEVCYDT